MSDENETRKAIEAPVRAAEPINVAVEGHNAMVNIVSFYGALLEDMKRRHSIEAAQLRAAVMQEAAGKVRAAGQLEDFRKLGAEQEKKLHEMIESNRLQAKRVQDIERELAEVRQHHANTKLEVDDLVLLIRDQRNAGRSKSQTSSQRDEINARIDDVLERHPEPVLVDE